MVTSSIQPSAPRCIGLAAGQKPCKSRWQMPCKLSVGNGVQRNLWPTRVTDFPNVDSVVSHLVHHICPAICCVDLIYIYTINAYVSLCLNLHIALYRSISRFMSPFLFGARFLHMPCLVGSVIGFIVMT